MPEGTAAMPFFTLVWLDYILLVLYKLRHRVIEGPICLDKMFV